MDKEQITCSRKITWLDSASAKPKDFPVSFASTSSALSVRDLVWASPPSSRLLLRSALGKNTSSQGRSLVTNMSAAQEAVRTFFVTLRRSPIGAPWFHKRILTSLGLKRRHDCVERVNTAVTRGQLQKVSLHLRAMQRSPQEVPAAATAAGSKEQQQRRLKRLLLVVKTAVLKRSDYVPSRLW
jgi:ribosomal protein L30